MKKIFAFTLLMIFSSTFAQKIKVDPQMLQMGWTFVSPLVLKKITDPLTKEIINKTIPQIINQDAKGAVFEVTDAIYRIKNVKVLNKEFLSQLETKVNGGIKAIQLKDYATAVNELAGVVVFADNYIKKGILDKTDLKIAATDLNVKNDIVKKEEINGKVYIEKNNSYYFFIPNGNFTEQDKTDTSQVKFMLKLDNGKSLEFGIMKQILDNEKYSVDWLQQNQKEQDKLNEHISKTLKTYFGDGILSSSTLATFANIKAIKYPYLASSTASMTNTFITFHNATLFIIYFKTPQSDFTETSKAFDELMNNFFFGKDISFCNLKNMGFLTIINKSTNPYVIYKNGNELMTIQGKGEENIYIELGTTNFKAIQQSGYVMYPTENKRTVTFNSACDKLTITIGYTD